MMLINVDCFVRCTSCNLEKTALANAKRSLRALLYIITTRINQFRPDVCLHSSLLRGGVAIKYQCGLLVHHLTYLSSSLFRLTNFIP